MTDSHGADRRPNILLIVSDQERQRDWLPPDYPLPNRQRLIDAGLEFTNHYSHTTPCSPSRASLFTGLYTSGHGVTENSTGVNNTWLPTTTPTVGHLLRSQGYTTAYKGKWHLEPSPTPDMDAYGFGDWEGNDQAWLGLPGTGTEYDGPIAEQGARWIRDHADDESPWFLTVALVNPHDIMWFPIDQAWYQQAYPEYVAPLRERLSRYDWGRADNLPGYDDEVERWFTELPENFHVDLFTKPEVHRRWMMQMVRNGMPGVMERDDVDVWLQGMDYYAQLHRLNDVHIGTILAELDAHDLWRDTVVIYTSDHGDQCGSQGLRSKGPWSYQESMRIPLYVVAPDQTTPGTVTDSLSCHMDLTVTIAELAGADPAGIHDLDLGSATDAFGPGEAGLAAGERTVGTDMVGESLVPLFADQSVAVREYVLFAQEWPWYAGVEQTRYASTGIFDGQVKYCRYYGIGGGRDAIGNPLPGTMTIGRDGDFEDHDHELYDLAEDPHEIINLAMDRSRRAELRERFAELRSIEHAAYGSSPFGSGY